MGLITDFAEGEGKIKIAFDIDGTIIHNTDDSPRYDVLAILNWFVEQGHEVFVWSGGGIDYARMVVRRLGLTDKVKVILKANYEDTNFTPDLAFDDMETALGTVNVRVRANASQRLQELTSTSSPKE